MRNEQLKKRFDSLSEIYDKGRGRKYFLENLEILEELFGDCKGKILEVGCGTGQYIKEFRKRGYDMVGVDYSEEMCKMARRNLSELGVDTEKLIRKADVEEDLGYENLFQVIVIMDSWEFLSKPSRVIQNVYNSLEEEGLLIIITPNPWFAPIIIFFEKLRIKKNAPSFSYYNSFKSRTIKQTERLFLLMKFMRTYWRMKYTYVFTKKSN